jgi:hypothetical protein
METKYPHPLERFWSTDGEVRGIEQMRSGDAEVWE